MLSVFFLVHVPCEPINAFPPLLNKQKNAIVLFINVFSCIWNYFWPICFLMGNRGACLRGRFRYNKKAIKIIAILPLLPATAKHIACSARRHSIPPPPPPGTELHANSHICIFEKPFFESEKRRDEVCK